MSKIKRALDDDFEREFQETKRHEFDQMQTELAYERMAGYGE